MENTNMTVQETGLPDILDREKRLGDIMKILNTVRGREESVTFALNGKWGVGKSFVLDRLMEQLRDETQKDDQNQSNPDKYVVFHYNCWQYDFYDEPLIAILTAMIDAAEPEAKRLDTELARQTLSKLKDRLMDTLIRVCKQYVFSHYGLDLTNLFQAISSAEELKAQAEQKAQSRMDFDPNYTLKKTIQDVQKMLRDYAGKKTLVIIVDELDRCLPDYAIKVLERLHHLFYGLPNTAVILGIDKGQLEQSIRQIFGSEIGADDYLRKIIHFEIPLDAGHVRGKVSKKYKPYFELFDKQALRDIFPEQNGIFHHKFDTTEFLHNLLTGIDIRRQEQLINRCMIVHKFLFGTDKKDYTFLCAELLWIVLTEEYGYTTMPIKFHYETRDGKQVSWFYVEDVDTALNDPPGAAKRAAFKAHFDIYLQNAKLKSETPVPSPEGMIYYFKHGIGIGELLIWYLSRMYKPHDTTYSIRKYPAGTPYVTELWNLRSANMAALEEFKNTLQIVK